MPELPEVQQLVLGVRGVALGGLFTSVEFFRDDIRETIDKNLIGGILLGQIITNVSRRGKYLLLHTAKGALGVHLGMSGPLVAEESNEPRVIHTHAVFGVRTGDDLEIFYHFIDPRRFGRLFGITPRQAKNLSHPYFENLGVEPLERPATLGRHLYKCSRGRKISAKSFIMNNAVLVGVGNIYASEALWRARLLPMKIADELTQRQAAVLAAEIVSVLNEAIASGGTTFRDYRNSEGKPGTFQNKLAVYDRFNQSCLRCFALVQTLKIAGRATYFCPVCQN
ncbi:MAG: bifunctional DNA-formamidopyrimidine glycosylase/DNA-(apurinic or apyrimidinic site) lyase [Proteobacteria bacterium]|nr:bifunctional DNA-formamidopyrimidine glycosylase/DNA-(apurinic or apyrimidinic site) lyase [Pseudomonadota bacterium]